MANDVTSWLRAPLWVAQLATGAKSFVDNPILGSPALNRRGLHVARLKLAHRLAWARRRRLTDNLAVTDREAFDRDGFVCIKNFLPAEEFANLREFLVSTEFEAREHRQGDTITRRVPVDDEMAARHAQLRGLLRSPRWRALMHYVASTGGEPLYYLQSIVTGLDGPPDPQVEFHSDAFHPSMKAWLFLTDVSADSGPLTYVPGSHLLTPARLKWEQAKSETVTEKGDRLSQRGSFRISRDEISRLGLAEPVKFAVPANTLVVADTFGFHARGLSSQASVRAELWAYRRRTPFIPWSGMDLLSLPGLALRRVQWAYGLVDWLDRRGWKQQHWSPVGRKRALDR